MKKKKGDVSAANIWTNKMTCALWQRRWISLCITQPLSLHRVLYIGSQGHKASSCRQRGLWSDWVAAQADLSLGWPHRLFYMFCHILAHLVCFQFIPRLGCVVSCPRPASSTTASQVVCWSTDRRGDAQHGRTYCTTTAGTVLSLS